MPQGDTASPYLFILVLEILLLRIQMDPNLERIKLEVRNYKPEDGGNIPILQVFADDMTVVIKETVEILILIRNIFKEFADISGLEINEGKTKIILFGKKLEDLTPLTTEVKFIYTTKFKLLGVDIDNQLLHLQENFIKRQKKINQKIHLWRKYNLSTIGNLIIYKTFLISQLGYLLSMMECDQEITKTIQKAIDKFVIRANHSWVSKERLYQSPDDGGLGAIHIETHANALRCAWAKCARKGLWANCLLRKVHEPRNICFITENDIYPMHRGIKMICRAFEALHNSYRGRSSIS